MTAPAKGAPMREGVDRCAATPDHSDILETIENAADDWKANGYASALAEVRDMANVGRSLMDALPKGYHYMDSPAEIVSDLQNELAEARSSLCDVGALGVATATFPPGAMYRSGHDGTGPDPSAFFCEAVSDAPECRRVRVVAGTEAQARADAAAALRLGDPS